MVPASRSYLRPSFTGGSTGIPLKVYHDTRADNLIYAASLRAWSWMGCRKGDKVAYVWGLDRRNKGHAHYRQNPIKRFLSNRVLLDAFDLDPSQMEEFLSLLDRFQPDLIVGYVSAVVRLAEHLANSAQHSIQPKAVQLTAERCEPWQRNQVEQTFRAPVYDQYGSCEIFWLAMECECHEGLHTLDDLRVVELLNHQNPPDSPDRGLGDIIATDLENYACPRIRYRNGDRARSMDTPCRCGRSFGRLEPIAGRVSDVIVTPSGKYVHGEFFTHVFYAYTDLVRRFQVHQTDPLHLAVKIVPAGTDMPNITHELRRRFTEAVGREMTITFEIANEIPREASGKFRFVKSDCAPTHGS